VGSLGGSLAYTLSRTKVTVGASASSSVRYYPSLEARQYVSGHSGSIGTTVHVSPRTAFSANGTVSYQPFSFTNMFPATIVGPLDEPVVGAITEPDLDQASTTTSYLSTAGTASFSQRLARRVMFSLAYSYQASETAFFGDHYTHHGGNGSFSVSLSRGLALRLGYGYQEARFDSGADKQSSQSYDVGLDFNRALSFSRRTTLQFSTGSMGVSDGRGNTSYRVIGSAHLNHEVGRTWLASAGYDRNLQFVDTILQPVFSDSVNGTFGGLLNRRTQVNLGVRGSIGGVASGQSANNDYDTYLGSAGLSFAVSRNVNLGADYTYYRYRFDSGVPLPPGVAHNVDRQSIRGSVSFWAPLFTRSRRPNAAR
jgi:opacity protein-like surface antigen